MRVRTDLKAGPPWNEYSPRFRGWSRPAGFAAGSLAVEKLLHGRLQAFFRRAAAADAAILVDEHVPGQRADLVRLLSGLAAVVENRQLDTLEPRHLAEPRGVFAGGDADDGRAVSARREPGRGQLQVAQRSE